MNRKAMIGTGWKMNKTPSEARQYAEALLALLQGDEDQTVEIFVLPPFTALAAVQPLLSGSVVGYGAQNMHWESAGAWTGEISAPMLVELGCRYVELGHSERREHFNERDELINRKLLKALDSRLTPILCIGETRDEKLDGLTQEVLARQCEIALRGVAAERVPDVVLAYEPRWAIGADEAASPAQIGAMHAFLRGWLTEQYDGGVAQRTRIIYGGSVTPANAPSIAALRHVDGLFVGRAALDPRQFGQLVELMSEAAVTKYQTQGA